MSIQRVAGSSEYVTGVLEQLFRGHGVEAVRGEDILVFPVHPGLWADGEAFKQYERTVQLDIRLGIEPGRAIIESVVGMVGEDATGQMNDAIQSFAAGTFHVLLTAFFGQPECHGTETLRWDIGGRERVAYLGPVTTRFGLPPGSDGQPDMGWFPAFEGQLKVQLLPPGTHWVRLYQARMGGRVLANEVLLDNELWHEMQDAMAAFDWPVSEKPYDVRLFLVVRDAG